MIGFKIIATHLQVTAADANMLAWGKLISNVKELEN